MVIGSAAIAVSSWARNYNSKIKIGRVVEGKLRRPFLRYLSKKLSMNEKFSYKIHEKILEIQILIKST